MIPAGALAQRLAPGSLAPGSLTRGVSGTSQFLGQVAGALRAAYHDGPIAPFGATVPYPNVGLACAIQETNTRAWIAQGRRPAGRLVRLLTEAEQQTRGATEPIYAMVFADMMAVSGATLAVAAALPTRIAPAIALRLSKPVLQAPGLPSDLRSVIDAVCPVLDVQQSRLTAWSGDLFDTVADQASAGRLVVGPAGPVQWLDRTEDGITRFEADDDRAPVAQPTLSGRQALASAHWLARKMLFLGRPLAAGDIIALTPQWPAWPLEGPVQITARFEGLGSVSARVGSAS